MSLGEFRGDRDRLEFESEILLTLKWRGNRYTVLGDADKAQALYRGEIEPSEVLVTNEVFLDIQKGERASNQTIKEIVIEKRLKESHRKGEPKERSEIGTKIEKVDLNTLKKEAATYIASKGRIKLPKKVRDKLIREKKEKLLKYMQKYAMNPSTHNPYPPKKVEDIFDEMASEIEIDPLQEAEKQIPRIVEVVSQRLPLRLEILTVEVNIPAKYTSKAYSELKKLAEIRDTKWEKDGSLKAELKIPGGNLLQLKRKLNDISRGQATSEIIGRKRIS